MLILRDIVLKQKPVPAEKKVLQNSAVKLFWNFDNK